MAELIGMDGNILGGETEKSFKPSSPKIKLSEYENYVCPKCGSKLFTMGFVVKKLPGVVVGDATQKEVPFPVEQMPFVICAKCGELAPFIKEDKDSMEIYEKLTSPLKNKEEKNDNSGLIL